MHVEPKIDFNVGQNQLPNIQNGIYSLVHWLSRNSQSHNLDSTLLHLMDRLSNKGNSYKVVTILEPGTGLN